MKCVVTTSLLVSTGAVSFCIATLILSVLHLVQTDKLLKFDHCSINRKTPWQKYVFADLGRLADSAAAMHNVLDAAAGYDEFCASSCEVDVTGPPSVLSAAVTSIAVSSWAWTWCCAAATRTSNNVKCFCWIEILIFHWVHRFLRYNVYQG